MTEKSNWVFGVGPSDGTSNVPAFMGALVWPVTDTRPPLPYAARQCRGHWHITVSGEDLATTPNELTYPQAMLLAERLNAGGAFTQMDADVVRWLVEYVKGDHKTGYHITRGLELADRIERVAARENPQ